MQDQKLDVTQTSMPYTWWNEPKLSHHHNAPILNLEEVPSKK
jgi:hypothetical protein